MSAAPVLTRGLTSWRSEINEVFPTRDKESDGWIGDQRHQAGSSGHNPDITGNAEYKDHDSKNEVRAIDVDKDLRNPKYSMEQLIQWLVTRARAGLYVPFRYFIFNGRIWSRSDGWKTRKYNGPNKHDKHAHFSGDYNQQADEWTGKLGLAVEVARVTKPQVVKMIKLGDVTVPELRKGMRDQEGSTQRIKRIQAILNWLLPGLNPLMIDGDYGKATAAGIAEVMKGDPKRSSKDGTVFGEAEYRKFFAL